MLGHTGIFVWLHIIDAVRPCVQVTDGHPMTINTGMCQAKSPLANVKLYFAYYANPVKNCHIISTFEDICILIDLTIFPCKVQILVFRKRVCECF